MIFSMVSFVDCGKVFAAVQATARDYNTVVYDSTGNEAIGIYTIHSGNYFNYFYKDVSNNNVMIRDGGQFPFLLEYKLVINTDTDKVDIYVNNILCTLQAPLKNSVSNIYKIVYKIPAGTGQDGAKMNVDDVKAY